MRTIARLIFEKSSAIICLTQSDAESVGRVGGRDKISIIPNGVDTKLFKPAPEKDPELVAWVGRLVPEKGLVYLLIAMREIVKERPSVRLVLVGDGILKADLLQLTGQLDLRENVAFLGKVERMKVIEVLAKASVFAFPSLKEGLPRSVLEAMSSGVPVVGSNVSGIRDVVKHGKTGMLGPSRDPHFLAKSIQMLLDDERLRRTMGVNARHEAVQKFSWNTVAQRMDAIYSDVTRQSISAS